MIDRHAPAEIHSIKNGTISTKFQSCWKRRLNGVSLRRLVGDHDSRIDDERIESGNDVRVTPIALPNLEPLPFERDSSDCQRCVRALSPDTINECEYLA